MYIYACTYLYYKLCTCKYIHIKKHTRICTINSTYIWKCIETRYTHIYTYNNIFAVIHIYMPNLCVYLCICLFSCLYLFFCYCLGFFVCAVSTQGGVRGEVHRAFAYTAVMHSQCPASATSAH